MEALPVKFREIILLCDVEEMSYQEIADTLAIPHRHRRRPDYHGETLCVDSLEQGSRCFAITCDAWQSKLEPYVDSELPEDELMDLEAHLRTCPTCAADALGRLQMKRMT